MAELQTDINVKIKLGDEKNSSGESNLPAIDKGSIVITKDTNRIYIDTTDDIPERIEIGENKQDKFANVTNPGICKVTMSNSGQTYFCNNSSDSGIYFDSSIRLLQGKGIKNDDDLVNKKYVDEMLQGKEDSITYKTHLTVGSITTDPDGGGRNTSTLESTSLSFSDKIASATLPSMLITPSAHNGTTPACLTFASPAQNTAVGNANVRLTGIAAPTADNDAVNRGYLTTKYGSTYYESQGKEFYLPGGSNMVIPNTEMGRLFMGSEGANSTDFKIYVNDPIDNGKLIITNLKTPVNNEDAANKAYVDSKAVPEIFEFQGTPTSNPSIKFNHETSNSTPGGFRLIGPSGMGVTFDGYYENNMLGYTISAYGPNPLLLAANIKKSPNATVIDDNDITNKAYVDTKQDKIGTISSTPMGMSLSAGNENGFKLSSAATNTTAYIAMPDSDEIGLYTNDGGTHLRVTTDDIVISQPYTPKTSASVVNRGYVDNIKTELLDAITHPYTYDETTKELTLIL